MKIFVKKIEGIPLPKKGSEVAAGYDIIATSDPKIVTPGNDTHYYSTINYVEYETNLFVAPSDLHHHILIHPRSSVSKYNLVLANSIGLVDNDYRGMIICRFKYIWQPEDFRIISQNIKGFPNCEKMYKKGDAIAQLVVEPTVQVEWVWIDNLSETKRGEGGFGSTSK